MIFPQRFALFGRKQPRHVHSLERTEIGVEHPGERGIDFDDDAGSR